MPAAAPRAQPSKTSESDLKKGLELDNILDFKTRPSLLSSEHPTNNYRGFVNVLIILLVLGNLRIVVQNLQKYGLLVNLTEVAHPAKWPNIGLTIGLNLHVILGWGIQRLGPLGAPQAVVSLLHTLNLLGIIAVPWAGIWYFSANPGGGVITLVFAVTCLMKMVSFASVSSILDQEAISKDSRFRPTLGQVYYFIAAPTLCFKPSYPRSDKIRWGWVCRRTVEFIGIWAGIYAVARQYIVPAVFNTMTPLHEGNLVLMAEGIIKIAIPNFIVWIMGFYSIFHVYLNILAELTCFGDREFYRDWWNSTTVGFFWRSWNLPVHTWMVAHVYRPLVNNGWRKTSASIVIFIISAVLHELVVSVPFNNFKFLAFGGMLAQVPLIELTKGLKGTQNGNVVFWLTIMLGQPMIVLLYARDYAHGYSGPWTDADTQTVMNMLGLNKTTPLDASAPLGRRFIPFF